MSAEWPEPYVPSEAQLYEHLRQLVRDHEKMLRDAPRNKAFLTALQQRVKPDSLVLDIGAGQGIWAITAAKLGAKRVVAVDSDELLMGLIKRLARENGVGDIVFPHCGYSTNLSLEREFDVVVGEIIGVHGFDENIVQVFHDARERFLKPGGALIPEQLSLHVALGRVAEHPVQPAASELNFAYFAQIGQNVPLSWTQRDQVEWLSPTQCLIDRDLNQDSAPLSLEGLRAQWQFDTAVQANCFVIWFRSRLSPGCVLSSRQTSSWRPVIYRLAPHAPSARHFALEFSYLNSGAQWQITLDAKAMKRQTLGAAAHALVDDLANYGDPVSPIGLRLINANWS